MSIAKLDFNSLTGDKVVDERRALRLVLAVLEDDLTRIASVAAEVYTDKRGHEIAVWELVIGMAGAVAMEWARVDKETAIAGILEVLANNPEEGTK